jgi:hypothetical protein
VRPVAWDDANPLARRARLEYDLASRHLPTRLVRRDPPVRSAFARLLERLATADLTTNPADVDSLKDAVSSELVRAARQR